MDQAFDRPPGLARAGKTRPAKNSYSQMRGCPHLIPPEVQLSIGAFTITVGNTVTIKGSLDAGGGNGNYAGTLNTNVTFNHTDLLYCLLNGSLSVKAKLNTDLTGVITGTANLTVAFPQWFVPNAKVQRVIGTVTVTISGNGTNGTTVSLDMDGKPENPIVGLFIPSFHLHASASGPGTPKANGVTGIDQLLVRAAANIEGHFNLFGLIPITLNAPQSSGGSGPTPTEVLDALLGYEGIQVTSLSDIKIQVTLPQK
jgi:hypothetical protein